MNDTQISPTGISSDIEILGQLEGVVEGILFLWVWCKHLGEAVRVDIFLNGIHVGQFAADQYREDLAHAGIGDGKHALRIDLRPLQKHFDINELSEVTVFTAAPTRKSLGTIKADVNESLLKRPSDEILIPIRDNFLQTLRALCSRALRDGELSSIDNTDDSPSWRRLCAPAARSLSSSARRVPVSQYADFVRLRLKIDRQFDISASEHEASTYLKWYLESYSPMRGDRRCPLSSEELCYWNENIIVPGQRFYLSRAALTFLLDNKSLTTALDLNSEDYFLTVAYWWAIERSRSLYVEDCLIPAQFVHSLNTVREIWRGRPYPLSRFMEIFFSRNSVWHFLDLEKTQHRLLLYVIVALIGTELPYLWRFVPIFWSRKLFTKMQRSSGSDTSANQSPFDIICAHLFPEEDFLSVLADYNGLLRRAGFDFNRMRHLTFTPRGDRMLAPALYSPRRLTSHVDVQVIGPLNKASGLGQATRMSLEVLRRAGLNVAQYDFDLDNPAPVGFSGAELSSNLVTSEVNLIHLNAETIPLAYAYLPDVFSGSYNIGYFFWELDSPAKCHTLALDLLDEIWVSSQYGVEIYQKSTDKPIIKVGMAVEETKIVERGEARALVSRLLGVADDVFVFLATFDSFSFIQRKNPVAVVRAFRDAFINEERVALVLKTHNAEAIQDPAQIRVWQSLREAIAFDKRIYIINETLSYQDLIKLKSGCDCYVSLHRSEGWGFGMIEAMNLGLPVIATAYSGNMEFCNDATCWLVDYDLQTLDRDDYIFVIPGQRWAEPLHESAVRRMQEVVSSTETRNYKAEKAREHVQQRFSAASVSLRYAQRLQEIRLFRAKSDHFGS